jgi:hypothetical protein
MWLSTVLVDGIFLERKMLSGSRKTGGMPSVADCSTPRSALKRNKEGGYVHTKLGKQSVLVLVLPS